jgi:hypothetical protein
MKKRILWLCGVGVVMFLSGEAGAVSGSWTNKGDGVVEYWTNNANWNVASYPGFNSANQYATLPGGASGYYTAILNANLPYYLGTLNLGVTGSGGSSRLIVTNATLTNTTLNVGNGGWLQIDNGGAVTGVTTYGWSGANGKIVLNQGGAIQGPMKFLSWPSTGTVTYTTASGGVWDACSNDLEIASIRASNTSYTNLQMTISGITVTNANKVFFLSGTTTIGPALNCSLVIDNGSRVVATNDPTSSTLMGYGNNTWAQNCLMQIGGTGPLTTFEVYGLPFATCTRVGYGSCNNNLIVTNAMVTARPGGPGSRLGSTNNTVSILAGATWNGLQGTWSIGSYGAGPDNRIIVDGGIVTNVGQCVVGGVNEDAANPGPASGNSVSIRNGGAWYSSGTYSGFAVGNMNGASSNAVYLGGAGARSTVSLGGSGSAVLLAAGGSAVKSNCCFNSVTITNANVTLVNCLGASAILIGAGTNNNDNSVSVLAGGVVTVPPAKDIEVGAGGTGSPVTGNTLLIAGGTVLGVNEVKVGKDAADTGNSVLVSGGGLLEANKLTIIAGSTGNSISNNAGIYQFTTNSPTLTPVALANIAINNGTVSFKGITNATVLCNQSGGKLDSTSKMAWYGTANAFRLNNATNLPSGQAYTFQPGTATNFARLELLNGSLYRGGAVAIGPSGTLVISNGVSTIVSNLTFDSTATLSVDLSSTNGYGSLVTLTNVSLNTCTLSVNFGAAPIVGYPFTIINNTSSGTTSGQFAGGSRQVVTMNGTGYVIQVSTTLGDGNDVVLTSRVQTRGTRLVLE